MTTVRIYQPSKTAMQSGRGKTRSWLVEFETEDPLTTHSLMGWVKSYDMRQELRLFFPSLRDALHFATVNGFSYTISNPHKISMVPKSYGFNFTNPRVRGD